MGKRGEFIGCSLCGMLGGSVIEKVKINEKGEEKELLVKTSVTLRKIPDTENNYICEKCFQTP